MEIRNENVLTSLYISFHLMAVFLCDPVLFLLYRCLHFNFVCRQDTKLNLLLLYYMKNFCAISLCHVVSSALLRQIYQNIMYNAYVFLFKSSSYFIHFLSDRVLLAHIRHRFFFFFHPEKESNLSF